MRVGELGRRPRLSYGVAVGETCAMCIPDTCGKKSGLSLHNTAMICERKRYQCEIRECPGHQAVLSLLRIIKAAAPGLPNVDFTLLTARDEREDPVPVYTSRLSHLEGWPC